MKVIIGEENLVYSPPVNEATNKWGVYAIPRMWRDISGELVIRFNGEIDMGDTDNMQAAPNLFFVSGDNGKTWKLSEDGEKKYPINILNGIGTPYTKVDNITLAFRERENLEDIKNTNAQKEFLTPCAEAIVKAYRYGDIPDEAKGVERITYNAEGKEAGVHPVTIDFPEREILVNAKGNNYEEFVEVRERVKQSIFKNPYFSSVTLLKDGTLVAVSCGQNPEVKDHYSGAAYLIESKDMGLTWKKRSVIASSAELPYGYTGDSHETSLALTKNGALICAMRMDMSINPDIEKPICDTMVAISRDNGFSWCTPFSISDSSVTPQIVSFDNGVIAVFYGRPGVHFKYSVDDGKTWSESYSIIGNTLEENREAGIGDLQSKYANTVSYSNIFVEKIDGNTVLVLYNNLKYEGDDGKRHKAAFVREVRFVA